MIVFLLFIGKVSIISIEKIYIYAQWIVILSSDILNYFLPNNPGYEYQRYYLYNRIKIGEKIYMKAIKQKLILFFLFIFRNKYYEINYSSVKIKRGILFLFSDIVYYVNILRCKFRFERILI